MGSHDQHSEEEVKSTSSDNHSIHSIPVPDQPEVESISAPLPTTDGIHSLPNPDHEDASSTEKQATDSIASQDPDPIFVPKSQRRGLLARVTILAEVENPKHYARRTKWLITFVVAVAGAAAPMGSAIILPGLSQIDREFHSSSTVTNLSVALYMLSMSIFPLWWSSFSETLGRRTIYLISFFVFLVFNILSAVSVNIAMFIVMRVLSGGAAASVQAVGAGTISDIWDVRERGNAMSIFYLGPLCGPLLAPIIGGALTQGLGWRSCMWFTTIYGGLLWFFILFFLPETLKDTVPPSVIADASEKDTNTDTRPTLSRTSTRQSVALKSKRYASILHRWFVEPLTIVLNLRIPAVALVVYYASITFGSLYVLNISVQQTFGEEPYNFSIIIVGLLYIPNSLGYFLASVFGGRWVDKIMAREAKKANRYDEHGHLIYRPEDRLQENAWLAAVIFPCALIWYGWTADKHVIWIVPMIANFFFGVGSMLIFAVVTTMLTEFMPKKASHGIALNNFVRNIFSCVGSLVASPLINWCGDGWLFTFIGIWCLVSGILVLWSMKRFGEGWRVKAAELMV
ncbi:MFS general substrate transporter, partial [Aureobasidium melanogenum]|uniref:MFS general substrate transporter n=1 Tax=Aureobasidium melanogenum (strain CBS 110374) TaxID=1043003 RepID=A0A074VNU1_AURM1